MTCHIKDETLSAWLLGHLPPSAAQALETHVAQCADCRHRQTGLEAGMAALQGDRSISAPEALKPRLMARLAAYEGKVVNHWNVWKKGLMAATVTALLVIGVLSIWPRTPWTEQKILQAYGEDFEALGYDGTTNSSTIQDNSTGLFGIPEELTTYFN